MPSTSTNIPPAVPIRFIIALPCERSGLTVTSGISATAGDRNVAMAISVKSNNNPNKTSGTGLEVVCFQAYLLRAGFTRLVYAFLTYDLSTILSSPSL